jgi:alkylation response protein AidB-like acyl-CoA dehydrogenase
MNLLLTEEQQLLKDSATGFATAQRDLNKLRRSRSNATTPQFDAAQYQQMVDLGWTAIVFPEDLGGLGLGYAELGIVLEELGRHLIHSPLLSSVVLGGSTLLLGGSDAQKSAVIPKICDGSQTLSLAYQESQRHAPYAIDTRLVSQGSGYSLTGDKQLVVDGGTADLLLVVARSSGQAGDRDGLSIVMVDPRAKGVSVKNNLLLDGSRSANVTFDNVSINPDAVLGSIGDAADVYDEVMLRAAAAVSADMVGGIQYAFETTMEYLKVREQFGVKIGTFQGLKHRAARWFCEVELSKSIVLQALRAIDDQDENRAKIVSACKARTSKTYHLAGNEGIQMHGGIGVTDEHDIGLYMKRARVTEILFGDATFHRSRFASLSGY